MNEEDTIANVVDFPWSQPNVTEVIVVDDKSSDNTVSALQVSPVICNSYI